MGAYHQMGHHSENLLFEPQLKEYAGAILSPVNYTMTVVASQVEEVRLQKPGFDVIFDSQLYVPQSVRGELAGWPYFPAAVDTADTSDIEWWYGVIDDLATCCSSFTPNAICSPAHLPKAFNDTYYHQLIRIGARLVARLEGQKTRPIQTFVVGLPDLTDVARALEIASIASRSKTPDIYLVLDTNLEPRREIANGDGLRGAMVLIGALSRAGFKLLVGFCSSDIVLWKAAGAASGATGKFFNLRRFTRSRWDEPSEGGQNLPYWFEEGLLAFIRDSDLVRLRFEGKLSSTSLTNPVAHEIFQKLDARKTLKPGEKPPAWVGLGWRQYMYWFADAEARLAAPGLPGSLMFAAETEWLALEDDGFLMEEARNDGKWLRLWRRAAAEYRKLLP